MILSNPAKILGYLVDKAIDKYRHDGAIDTAKCSISFFKMFVGNGFRLSSYQAERTDLDHRWRLLRPQFESTDCNLLDIGCAEGDTVGRASALGLLALGIDHNEFRLTEARRRNRGERAAFINIKIDRDNIKHLPKFDVVCLLTVYHILGDTQGWSDAEEILRCIAHRSEKVFFEPPGAWAGPHPFEIPTDEPFDEEYRSYLSSVLENADIDFLGYTHFNSDAGQDPVFVINTEDC